MFKFLCWVKSNVRSYWVDGRTLGQKKKFIYKYYPSLYRKLYEIKD